MIKTLINALAVLTVIASVAIVVGCESDQKADSSVSMGAISLCGGCGQVKGSDVCCDADAQTCSGCYLVKGSPGCCKMAKGEDVVLCTCGAIKGSDLCCDADAPKCASCGKIKGTPGCCIGN